ncbi:alpha/beta-hydrolase [Fistulina hepatica ATCC 64428]|nr:alpha/beta-hydrolase [Fistulina hepatica ATCC 64428]
MENTHLHIELADEQGSVVVPTHYGLVRGARAKNGSVVFLEVPYALPPKRFEDPVPLPADYQYPTTPFKYESKYAIQPSNDGQSASVPFQDKVGLGKPSENPLFVNMATPPSFPYKHGFPVKIYIHGGFLQFGSPHSLASQPQYVAAGRSEVWVNIGYRLSAFGFLACDQPRINGNFGFKDQWLALEWIRDNIEAFGGDPMNIQVTGLSAGAHSVHQLLHHASHLPPGVNAPFQSAILQSNAMMTDPKTPAELRSQFRSLCHALGLDADAPDVLETLRDPERMPWADITHVIETDRLGVEYGTFRGCLSEDWLPSSPGPMEWQRSGGLARGLRAAGVRSVILGDTKEEWYLYSIAHPVSTCVDIRSNLERYYGADLVDRMMKMYKTLPADAPHEAVVRLYGDIFSDGQVHIPVRLLHRDLQRAGFPVMRYEIRWTPEQLRPKGGYVTHGGDRTLWAFRVPVLTERQQETARAWLTIVANATKKLENWNEISHRLDFALTLNEDLSIVAQKDSRWEHCMRVARILPGESD